MCYKTLLWILTLLRILFQLANRPLSKVICDEQFLGEAQSRTAEYLDVFEEYRQASTPKLPLEIGFAWI
ncbi:MAG: hypothetical protein NMK33_01945 [Candidatus Cardinium sp.]|uniref:hypothetical protein n=1 Tax=Cardinium endosymbiont of Dermatophagoides farinae TaxID=2597823 RepID=UPI001183B2F1|nr:hypothetical protein [Cardinium endosymbiont of Dermatophagoides farinae]TSJ81248.1 hypothetical protein FPG78_04620 [Cardinium endosymbiont of Dermatophagoides farinae]UWW97305.1 MAG: hypothetical protein NMK33_01945 [Candidatus Cardinium sp.]